MLVEVGYVVRQGLIFKNKTCGSKEINVWNNHVYMTTGAYNRWCCSWQGGITFTVDPKLLAEPDGRQP